MDNGKLLAKLLVWLLVALVISTTTVAFEQPYGKKFESNAPLQVGQLQTSGKVVNVTLITGDVVFATIAENGTVVSVSVSPSDPTKLGQNFLILKMHNSTYVIPSNIDLSIYDLDLFNIDLLIKEGYSELPYIPVIVQTSKIDLLSKQLSKSGMIVGKEFPLISALSVKVPKGKVLGLLEGVKKVWLDRKVRMSLNESLPLIGVPIVWDFGLNGSGVRIAILDTGIDSRHADFYFPNGTSKIEMKISFVDYDFDGNPDEPPDDYQGHGTHVASIAAGTGAKSGGEFKGVAYDAILWNVKVLDRYGSGHLSWIISGIEFAALGPDGISNTGDEADILSLSLGAYSFTDGTDPLSMACDRAVEEGRIVVVAAGNWGEYFTIGTPATAKKVITVGATDKQDILAYFSSRGPTVDYRIKPDVLAPGVGIWAALANGSEIEGDANSGWIPAVDVDEDGRYDYVQLSGTSMSTPHVSGIAALIKQMNSSLGSRDVKNILISTAVDLGYNVYQQGGGRVNVTSAISTPVLIDPATISFGVVKGNSPLSSTIKFTFSPPNPAMPLEENITLSLDVSVRDILSGSYVNAATLNATKITIPLHESREVLLTVDTSVPASIYDGRIVARVEGGSWDGTTLHAIFGFTKVNVLKIKMLDREGNPAAYREVIVIEHNATYCEQLLNCWFVYTDENGEASISLTRGGEFDIVGIDWDYGAQADVWITAERVAVNEEEIEVVLDGRNAKEVNFDPSKPNQVFAAKRSTLVLPAFQITSLWYYPTTALTYVTETTFIVSFGYEYYDMEYFLVASPDVIDAPEWHNLIYWQSGIKPPVSYVADYDNLVKRLTEYRVPMTPKIAAMITQHKFSPFEFSSEFDWLMNVPRDRVEWLTPDVYYLTLYRKYSDPPWIQTPEWFFAYWPILKEKYPAGEVREVFGGHPLTGHLHVFAGERWLEIVSDIHMDNYGHTLWTDTGHVQIYRNGELIIDGDVWDFFRYSWFDDPRPSKYRVEIDGHSGLWLSSYTRTTFEFEVVNESLYYSPPNVYVAVDGLRLNNTLPGGEVIVRVYVDDPRISSEAEIAVKFSLDDGETWNDAEPLEHSSGEPYAFSLGTISDANVSLWIDVRKTGGNTSVIVIRGFHVLASKLSAISIVPTFVKISRESIASVNLTVDHLENGLSGYNITVWLYNPEIAEIVAVEFPEWATLNDNSSLPADSVWIKAVDLNNVINGTIENVTLATLKIRGDQKGKSSIQVHITTIDDDSGNPINVTVIHGEIEVIELIPFPGFTNPPTDPDGDGLYEDINGNNRKDFNDVVIFFKYLEWVKDNQPIDPFDFNGNQRIDFDDVVKLFRKI